MGATGVGWVTRKSAVCGEGKGCGRLRAGSYNNALRCLLRGVIRGFAPLRCWAALRLEPTCVRLPRVRGAR